MGCKTATVQGDTSGGGSGGTGGGGSSGDALSNINVSITNKTGDVQYGWVSYKVENTSSQEIEVEMSYSPSGGVGSKETITLSGGHTHRASVEWNFDNTSDMDQQLCVEATGARYT